MNDSFTMTSTSATVMYSIAPGSTHPPSGPPYEYTVAVGIRHVYMWVLLAVGLPCNAACVVTILSMHVTTATFYVALLAAADSLALIVKAIYFKTTPSVPWCKTMYINNFFSCYANWVLVLILFQRFYAVCFPLKIKGAFTKTRIYISAAALALVLFVVVVVPTFFLLQWREHLGLCSWKDEFQQFGEGVWDAWIISLLYSYLPVLFMVVFTTLIIVGLQRHRRERSLISAGGAGSSSSDGKAERAITVMLVCAAVLFVLLTLPACLYHLYISDLYNKAVPQELAEWYLLYQVVTVLSDANHAVNFFIYFASMQRFRRCFLHLLRRCLCFKRGVHSFVDSTDTQETTHMTQADQKNSDHVASDTSGV